MDQHYFVVSLTDGNLVFTPQVWADFWNSSNYDPIIALKAFGYKSFQEIGGWRSHRGFLRASKCDGTTTAFAAGSRNATHNDFALYRCDDYATALMLAAKLCGPLAADICSTDPGPTVFDL